MKRGRPFSSCLALGGGDETFGIITGCVGLRGSDECGGPVVG